MITPLDWKIFDYDDIQNEICRKLCIADPKSGVWQTNGKEINLWENWEKYFDPMADYMGYVIVYTDDVDQYIKKAKAAGEEEIILYIKATLEVLVENKIVHVYYGR